MLWARRKAIWLQHRCDDNGDANDDGHDEDDENDEANDDDDDGVGENDDDAFGDDDHVHAHVDDDDGDDDNLDNNSYRTDNLLEDSSLDNLSHYGDSTHRRKP